MNNTLRPSYYSYPHLCCTALLKNYHPVGTVDFTDSVYPICSNTLPFLHSAFSLTGGVPYYLSYLVYHQMRHVI